MKPRLQFFPKLIICTVILGFAGQATRSQNDAVIVQGDPPLTRLMVGKTIVLLDWALGLKLSREQKLKVEQALVHTWQTNDREGINGALEVVQTYEKVAALTEAERNKVRGKLEEVILRSMRENPHEALSQLLLSAYEAAHPGGPNAGPRPNETPTAAKHRGRFGADGFTGIYRLVRPKMVGVGVITEYITFLPDGHVYWSLPPAGLLYFNPAEAQRARPNDWGTYEINDGVVNVLRGPEKRRYELPRNGENLHNPPALGKGIYRRMPPADGLRLEGTYRQNETGPSITFSAGGRFDDAGAFRYSGYTRLDGTSYVDDGVGGPGTYSIEQNTLELRYSDGRVKRFAFLTDSGSLAKKPAVDYFSINWNEIMKRY